jgi:hypothetical protein
MLKKIIEPVIKCPNKCPCSDAIKKIYQDLKIKVIPLNIQKDEKPKITPPVDRRERCD